MTTPHPHVRTGLAGLAALVLSAGAALAQQCPSDMPGGVPISGDSNLFWAPQSYPVMAGGSLSLASCGSVPGVGQITQAPNFTLGYDAANEGRDLEFRIQSDCDTVMLIKDAGGAWHYQDDSDGSLNPTIRLPTAASGGYHVWTGVYGGQSCPATLVVETFPGSGGQVSGCPDWSLGGSEINLMASQLGARQEFPVTAGGGINLGSVSCNLPASYGHVAAAPDFSLRLDTQGTSGNLIVGASGACDTLMLMNDNAGNWHFNDDTNGLDPQIVIENAQSGRYDVWIGTFGSSLCQATMYVEGVPAGGGAATK
jgi:hypothetical protein